MYKKIFILLFVISIYLPVPFAEAFSWYEQTELKITIETDRMIYEWEYENPDEYEYEEGNTIWRGDVAKDSFENILSFLDLAKPDISQEVINSIEQKTGINDINRVVIYRVDAEKNFKTWHWNRLE